MKSSTIIAPARNNSLLKMCNILTNCKSAILSGALILVAHGVALCAGAIDTTTRSFDPKFRTLTVTRNDNLMADPVLTLSDPADRLTISFDELTEDRSYLRARLIHCNADWQPSALSEPEYVEGFNQADIEDFGYSANTYVHYVNYKFSIPEEGLRPLVSGNYLLQIYDSDDPDTTLLQQRFRVSENSVAVNGHADGRTDRGFNSDLQQLELALTPRGQVTYNPYADIFVEVLQNSRPDTSRILQTPSRMQGQAIIYDHRSELIFPAGNEYRRFETVRNNYPGMGVDHTAYEEPMYNAWLQRSLPRDEGQYIFDQTQHGRFKIDEYNSTDPDLGADYILTHFSLEMEKLPDADVYVEGDLTGRGYSDLNRMHYIDEEGIYALSIPLKQGSYNFQYVAKPRIGNRPAEPGRIEGNHFETLNEYNTYVWLRTPGSRADRLVGSSTIVATP